MMVNENINILIIVYDYILLRFSVNKRNYLLVFKFT